MYGDQFGEFVCGYWIKSTSQAKCKLPFFCLPKKSFHFFIFERMQLPKTGTIFSNCARQSKLARVGTGWGGGGYSKTFYTGGGGGGLRTEIQPFSFGYTFFERKGSPFVYVLSTNGTPFTYPFLEFGIPFNCFKCTVLKILINHTTNTFSGLCLSHDIHLLALLILFISQVICDVITGAWGKKY